MADKARLMLGIEALRSGEFRQGRNALRSGSNGELYHCCLGVLTEVALRNGCVLPEGTLACADAGCDAADGDEHTCPVVENIWELEGETLPEVVREWYGLPSSDPYVGTTPGGVPLTAVYANDNEGWDFATIADAFQAVYVDETDRRGAK